MKNIKSPLFIRLPKQICSATGLPFYLDKGNFIMEEIWKDVIGYEGLYKISNLGNIKSFNYLNRQRIQVLKPRLSDYNRVVLSNKKKTKTLLVHRIIAIAFLPNPQNKKCVNHKDGNKLNNNLENLEWVTHKENSKHSFNMEMNKINSKNIITKNIKKVINIKNGIIYESITMAANELGYNKCSLSQKLRGFRKNDTILIYYDGYK